MRFALTFAAALAATAQPALAAPSPKASVAVATPEMRLPHISIVAIGKGQPVVLIPGLSSPRAVWEATVAEIGKDHRLILVQVNGFAADDPGANLQPGILTGIGDDLHAYLQREKPGPVHLVGHSMGGLAGLLFANAHPEDVAALMVVDALPFFPVLMDPNVTVEQARPVAAMMRDKVASAYGKPQDPAMVEANVKSLALKSQSLIRMKAWAAAADPRVTAGALYEDMTTDARPLLPAIKAPLTVLVPWSESAFGRERTLAFYSKQYAGSAKVRFADIGDAGHFVMLDQPTRFAEELKRFLAE